MNEIIDAAILMFAGRLRVRTIHTFFVSGTGLGGRNAVPDRGNAIKYRFVQGELTNEA